MEKALRTFLPNGRFGRVPRQRSEAMGKVRGTGNKTTELLLRLALARAGLRGWRVRPPGMLGRPDFVFGEERVVIFADGCFWHGCPACSHAPIRTNARYWRAKIQRNRERDARTLCSLRRAGWRVVRVWEHELRISPARVVAKIKRALATREK